MTDEEYASEQYLTNKDKAIKLTSNAANMDAVILL